MLKYLNKYYWIKKEAIMSNFRAETYYGEEKTKKKNSDEYTCGTYNKYDLDERRNGGKLILKIKSRAEKIQEIKDNSFLIFIFGISILIYITTYNIIMTYWIPDMSRFNFLVPTLGILCCIMAAAFIDKTIKIFLKKIYLSR